MPTYYKCSLNEPWSFAASHCPHAFYKSVCLEVSAAPHYNNRDGVIFRTAFMLVFHQSKCISATKRIPSNTAMYIVYILVFFHVFVFLVTAMHALSLARCTLE